MDKTVLFFSFWYVIFHFLSLIIIVLPVSLPIDSGKICKYNIFSQKGNERSGSFDQTFDIAGSRTRGGADAKAIVAVPSCLSEAVSEENRVVFSIFALYVAPRGSQPRYNNSDSATLHGNKVNAGASGKQNGQQPFVKPPRVAFAFYRCQ